MGGLLPTLGGNDGDQEYDFSDEKLVEEMVPCICKQGTSWFYSKVKPTRTGSSVEKSCEFLCPVDQATRARSIIFSKPKAGFFAKLYSKKRNMLRNRK